MNIDTLYDYLKLTVPNTFGVINRGNGIEVGVRAGTLYGSYSSEYFCISGNLIKFSTILDEVPDYITKAFGGVIPHKLDTESNGWRKVYAFKIPKDLQ